MTGRLMQDMQPSKKRRSLRDAVGPASRDENRDTSPKRVAGQYRATKSKRSFSFSFWFIGIIAVIFLFFLFVIIFSGSKILVYPHVMQAQVDQTFGAYKQADTDQLQYEIMTITREGSKAVEASGESFVEEKASGMITVYNDHSEEDQRLVENTRFRSPDGSIYRIDEPLVVPGQSVVGGETVPGSITVKVYADAPGEEYNNEGDSVTFDIPGFEGSPQFESFWAESETGMSGGFRGVTKVVSEEDRVAARNEIQEELRQNVLNDVHSQIPEGFTLLEDAVFIQFEPLTNSTSDNGEVLVREKAIVRSVIFDSAEIASFLATQSIADYSGEDILINNMDDVAMALVNKEAFQQNMNEVLSFSVSGEPTFVWQYDAIELAQNFVGKKKSDIDKILMSYPAIDKAEIILRPFWRRSFPEEVREIKIETILEIDN